MVYLINDNNKQDVFIPRNDGQGSYVSPYDKGYQDGYGDGCSDCANMDLQNKTVIVTADTQTVLHDDGYDGLFEVDVDASGYGRTKYDEGYGEGYNKGEEDQKARLSSATFVENGEYTLENGWSAVTVQTTCPPPNLENKNFYLESGFTGETITPSSGYDGLSSVRVEDHGYGQERYDDGFSDGETTQRGRLVSTAITANGIYSRADGYSQIDVQVPVEVPCNIESGKSINLVNFPGYETTVVPSSGYAGLESVHVEGSDIYSQAVSDVSRQFVPLTATTNGVYLPQSEFAVFSSVTVAVDTNLESKSVTMTATTETITPSSGYDGMSAVTVDAGELCHDYYDNGYNTSAGELGTILYVTNDYATAATNTVSASTYNPATPSPIPEYEALTITSNENEYFFPEYQYDTYYEFGKIVFDGPLGRIHAFSFASGDKDRVTELIFPDTMKCFMGIWNTGNYQIYETFGQMANLRRVRFPAFLQDLKGFNSCPNLEDVFIPRTCVRINCAFGQSNIKKLEIPNCTGSIERNTLRCSAIERLEIHGTCEIGKGFCSGRSWSGFTGTDKTPALQEIYCYSTIAPVFSENNTAILPSDPDAPFADQAQNGVLYVPAGYTSAYANWLNFLPSGWTISDTL